MCRRNRHEPYINIGFNFINLPIHNIIYNLVKWNLYPFAHKLKQRSVHTHKYLCLFICLYVCVYIFVCFASKNHFISFAHTHSTSRLYLQFTFIFISISIWALAFHFSIPMDHIKAKQATHDLARRYHFVLVGMEGKCLKWRAGSTVSV